MMEKSQFEALPGHHKASTILAESQVITIVLHNEDPDYLKFGLSNII